MCHFELIGWTASYCKAYCHKKVGTIIILNVEKLNIHVNQEKEKSDLMIAIHFNSFNAPFFPRQPKTLKHFGKLVYTTIF